VYELEIAKENMTSLLYILFLFFWVQVSVGTLLAFTTAAVSVLILRYVPPDEVQLPSSLHESIDSMSSRLSGDIKEVNCDNVKDPAGSCHSNNLHDKGDALLGYPLIENKVAQGNTSLHALHCFDFNP
jgi:cationic amino acid transporter 1